MKSILDLLSTIMSIPHVNTQTRIRATFLHRNLGGGGLGDIFGNLFGGAR